jgi:hypothetical protein
VQGWRLDGFVDHQVRQVWSKRTGMHKGRQNDWGGIRKLSELIFCIDCKRLEAELLFLDFISE